MTIKSQMIEKIVLYVIATAMSLSIATITFFASATYDQLQSVSSQMTGHLIQHGKGDTQLETITKTIDKMNHNQYILCKYGELTWPNHDRCAR